MAKIHRSLIAGIGTLLVLIIGIQGYQNYTLSTEVEELRQTKETATSQVAPDPFTSFFSADPFADDPLADFWARRDSVNNLFNPPFAPSAQHNDWTHWFSSGFATPEVELQERDDAFVIEVVVPETENASVDVQVEDDYKLHIKVESSQQQQANGSVVGTRSQRASFEKTVTLPGPVRGQDVWSEFADGTLRIEVPKIDRG